MPERCSEPVILMTGSMAGAEAVSVYRSEDEVPEPDDVRPFPNEGG